jgi:hypothetical protein
VTRRAVGALLAALGAGAALAASAGMRTATVLAAARASALDGPLGGSTTSGASSGGAVHGIVISGAGRAILAGAPWRAAAVAGGVVILLAGLVTVWRGARWPVMSARFERPQHRGATLQANTETMWESLSRDVDPTVDGGTRT